MKDITAPERDTLYLLCDASTATAEELREDMNEYYPRSFTRQQVDSYLSSLADAGLVKETEAAETTTYCLTDLGVRTLAERRNWEESLGLTPD